MDTIQQATRFTKAISKKDVWMETPKSMIKLVTTNSFLQVNKILQWKPCLIGMSLHKLSNFIDGVGILLLLFTW